MWIFEHLGPSGQNVNQWSGKWLVSLDLPVILDKQPLLALPSRANEPRTSDIGTFIFVESTTDCDKKVAMERLKTVNDLLNEYKLHETIDSVN